MQNKKSISLKVKLLLLSTLVTSLALILAGGLLLVASYFVLLAERNFNLISLTNIISQNGAAAIAFQDRAAATEILESLDSEQDILSAEMWTASGESFVKFQREGSYKLWPDTTFDKIPVQEFGVVKKIEDNLVTCRQMKLKSQTTGFLCIQYGLASLFATINNGAVFIFLILVVSGFAATSLSGRMRKQITDPLVNLARIAEEVSKSKNYDLRAAVTSNDEIGTLLSGFNAMLQEIQSRDIALKNSHEMLERRVIERTSELQAENDLRSRTEDALRAEKELLREIVRNAPVAMAMFDSEMRYVVYSALWLQDYKINHDITGQSHYEIFPEVSDEWRQIYQRALSGERQSRSEDTVTTTDGEKMTLAWAIHPWFKADGTPGGIVIASLRIDELVLARKTAVRNFELRTQFFTNISHELRTPLNGVLGYTELLKSLSLNSEAAEYVDAIQESGQILLLLVNDILDFSKIEAKKIVLEREEFSINGLLSEVINALSPSAKAKKLALTAHSMLENDRYIGDAFRIRQVLFNLVGNGIKFTDSGSVEIEVRSIKKERIVFSVIDSGTGISKEKRTVIFDAFSQADGSITRKHGGTGLGLAISKEIIDLMGGRIWVESNEGGGSIFSFEVTLAPSLGSANLPTLLNKDIDIIDSENITEESSDSISILIAEDNIVNQKLVLRMLEKQGHKCVLAKNGQQVVDLSKQSSFDLILMDLQMPVLGGLEAIRIIRGDSSNPSSKIPIVALTAQAFEEDREKCLSVGADDFLSKPVRAEELRRIIQLWGRRAHQDG